MKICFVSDYHPSLPFFGGIAVYTDRIARTLVRRGHTVHVVVAKADRKADFEAEGVQVHYRQSRWLPLIGRRTPGLGESIGIATTLAGLHKRHRFDLVEIPNWEGMGYASTFAPGLRVVIRLHTSVAESIEMAGRPPTCKERFMIRIERASTRRARAVVTHSEAHRDRMAAAYGRQDITVIPHGVEIPETSRPPAGRMVLSIGRMNARKGMTTLIEAIPAVLAQAPDAVFKIAGPAEEEAGVKEFRAAYPALRQVEFLGIVPGERLGQLYEECALYVSPAVYESFGLTFAEAMARARPVVGCAASAVPEIVRDGIDGLLVPPRDAAALGGAIAGLLSNPERGRQMGASGRQRAIEEFSIEISAARIERFFEGVIAGG